MGRMWGSSTLAAARKRAREAADTIEAYKELMEKTEEEAGKWIIDKKIQEQCDILHYLLNHFGEDNLFPRKKVEVPVVETELSFKPEDTLKRAKELLAKVARPAESNLLDEMERMMQEELEKRKEAGE